MLTPEKLMKRQAFLDRYGSGMCSYMRREGLLLWFALTILFTGTGALGLSGGEVNVGYLFLLIAVSALLGFGGAFATYSYKVTQARKAVAVADQERGLNFNYILANPPIDKTWNDASSVRMPAVPSPAWTAPTSA
ncbi:hypothetical protein BGW42_000702 [Actinomortierella wolfii]|nr:hypothetical protein BGW42_000702 [Actinomortierella wolfii]